MLTKVQKIIIGVITSVVVLGIAAILIWYFLFKQHTKPNPPQITYECTQKTCQACTNKPCAFSTLENCKAVCTSSPPTPYSGRSYSISLYQGGVPQKAKNDKNAYNAYQTQMVDFAINKKIDHIYIDLSSPSTFKTQTIDSLVKILNYAAQNNYKGTMGVNLEVSSDLEFYVEQNELTKYFDGEDINKTTKGGQSPFEDDWETPQYDSKFKSCWDYINHSQPDTCPTSCGPDSYCQNGVCHGCPNTQCKQPAYPKGCPNQLQVAFRYIGKINEVAQQDQKQFPNPVLFTQIVVDKENGIYAPNLFLYMTCAKKWLQTTPQTMNIDLAQAADSTMTPQAWIDEAQTFCQQYASASNKPNCSKTFPTTTTFPNTGISVSTFPEYYWFGELKPQGCVGCPHTLTTKQLQYTTNQQIKEQDSSCQAALQQHSDIDPEIFEYYQESNMKVDNSCENNVCKVSKDSCTQAGGCPVLTLYDICIQQVGDDNLPCCQALGCTTCKYNKDGEIDPSTSIIYQANRNQPEQMLKAMMSNTWNVDMGKFTTSIKDKYTPTTKIIPMLSNEISHDWDNLTDGTTTYSIDGASGDSNNTCITRKFGGDTCGTFDGFGNWTWDKFEEYMTLMATTYKLKHIGIYEWQFVPPNWLQ